MGRERSAAKTELNERQYLYKDEEMRLKRSNHLVFLATVVICVIISLYLILRMMWKETNRPMLPQIANWINMLVLITNIVAYKSKKFRKKFRMTNAISLGVVFIVVAFMTDATFIYWMLAGVLIANLTYFDWKYSKRLGIFYFVSYMATVIYSHISGGDVKTADKYALFLVIIAVIVLSMMVTKLINLFMNAITTIQTTSEGMEKYF